ncbi:MAG: hypothetical protein CME64_05975 [Halobacteriovoraceae bacterium]|nr:hypothetical protein [Halobacteriovoraceae bacterium]
MSNLIKEPMNNPYQNALRRFRKSSSNTQKGYIAELYPTDWMFCEYEVPEQNTPESKVASTPDIKKEAPKTVTEKTKVLDSFHEFANKELEKLNSDTLKFPGGEAKKKSFGAFEGMSAKVLNVEELKNQSSSINSELGRLKFANRPQSLKVLFVAQETVELSTLSEGSSGLEAFFEPKASALFERMILAMKLKDGDSFVSSFHTKLNSSEDSFEQELANEIFNLKPQVVIPLGGVATSKFLGPNLRLQTTHGQFFEREVKSEDGSSHKFEVMPLFSPAFLVEAPNTKRAAWEDMQKVMKKLNL